MSWRLLDLSVSRSDIRSLSALKWLVTTPYFGQRPKTRALQASRGWATLTSYPMCGQISSHPSPGHAPRCFLVCSSSSSSSRTGHALWCWKWVCRESGQSITSIFGSPASSSCTSFCPACCGSPTLLIVFGQQIQRISLQQVLLNVRIPFLLLIQQNRVLN